MKVLVISNFGMGLYKFKKEILKEMINQGHEVFVSFPKDEYVSLIEELGCLYIESKVDRRGNNLITDFKLLLFYIKTIKKTNANIVLTFTIKPNVYGGIASRITRTPYLPNITGLGTAIENEGFMKTITLALYKIALKKAKCVFFQNEPNRNFFIEKKIVKLNTKVIPGSGVNLETHNFEDYPKEEGNIKFLFIGRIMQAKGINELLESFINIRKKYSNVELNIIGFCEENYLDRLKELNDTGIIRYHGKKNEVHNFIKNSHAIILPSYHEGMSNVLLESASTGRPIIASKVPGCIETFEEGISGFGFEAKNSEKLEEVLIKFIELSYEKKKEMGIQGRRKMENEYDRKIITEIYLNELIDRSCENEFI